MQGIDYMIIELNQKDIMNAADYGKRVAIKKKKESLANSHFIGKLGEIALQKMLHRYNIDVTIDLNDYAIGGWDNNDIHFNGWDIDVKCLKAKSDVCYIDFAKLNFREKDGQLPHYFVITRHLDVLDIKDLPDKTRIEMSGFIDIRAFWKDDGRIKNLHAGEILPGTKVRADREYYISEIQNLEHDWVGWARNLMVQTPFSTDFVMSRENTETEQRKEIPFRYSILLSGKYAEEKEKYLLQYWICHGRKVLIFLPSKRKPEYQSFIDTYDASGLFQFYDVATADDIPELEIMDGRIKETNAFDQLCKITAGFNKEQYLVEHAPADGSLIVKASAGTGKTTVMIDRVMYLLAVVDDLSPDNITMITFTNDAANHMREKIEEKLIQRYQVTRLKKYLQLMENLADMQISTIDSFFKKVISLIGTELGYGINASVRSFTHEKHLIMRDVIDELFRNDKSKDYLQKFILTTDKYRKLSENCWAKLNSQGYYQDAIEQMDFGHGIDRASEAIDTNLKGIVVETAKRYNAWHVRKNAFSLNDFSADMNQLVNTTHNIRGRLNIKYLFVDEFQDTDNGQIKAITWLKQCLDASLFVVGDTKQSIYRFRGAEETAFDKLQDELDGNITEYELIKNYRTDEAVIKPLNHLFSSWYEKKLLQWEKVAVAGKKCGAHRAGQFVIETYDRENSLKQKFKQVLSTIDGRVCVLNRKNRQVNEVAQWCREAHIPCIAKTDGGFYQGPAVLDVLHLLGAVLYSADARYLFNYLMSSYSGLRPSADEISNRSGKEQEILDYLNGLAEQNNWKNIKQSAKMIPFFQWFLDVVDYMKPQQIYAGIRRHELEKEGFEDEALNQQVEYDVESYDLNLNKLVEELYQGFSNDFASLLSVYTYLLRKVQTDATEDAVYPQPDSKGQRLVECMTVHKAKGLEWDTVMITHMNDPYIFNPDSVKEIKHPYQEFLVYGKPDLKIGWYYRDKIKGDQVFKNDFYTDEALNKEHEAVAREEARILYVALTRAKWNLYCFMPRRPDRDTWADFMSRGITVDD